MCYPFDMRAYVCSLQRTILYMDIYLPFCYLQNVAILIHNRQTHSIQAHTHTYIYKHTQNEQRCK